PSQTQAGFAVECQAVRADFAEDAASWTRGSTALVEETVAAVGKAEHKWSGIAFHRRYVSGLTYSGLDREVNSVARDRAREDHAVRPVRYAMEVDPDAAVRELDRRNVRRARVVARRDTDVARPEDTADLGERVRRE